MASTKVFKRNSGSLLAFLVVRFSDFLFFLVTPYSKHNVKTKTGCSHFVLVAALHLVITNSQWQQLHPGIPQLFDSVDSVADDDLNGVMLIAGAVCGSFLDANIAVVTVLGGTCVRHTRTLFLKKRRQPGA